MTNFNQERKLTRRRRPVWPACHSCGTAEPGEVCVDCNHCRTCGQGCIECLPYRRKAGN